MRLGENNESRRARNTFWCLYIYSVQLKDWCVTSARCILSYSMKSSPPAGGQKSLCSKSISNWSYWCTLMFPYLNSTNPHYCDRCIYMQTNDGKSIREVECWHLSIFHFVSNNRVMSILDDSAKPQNSFNDIENLCILSYFLMRRHVYIQYLCASGDVISIHHPVSTKEFFKKDVGWQWWSDTVGRSRYETRVVRFGEKRAISQLLSQSHFKKLNNCVKAWDVYAWK